MPQKRARSNMLIYRILHKHIFISKNITLLIMIYLQLHNEKVNAERFYLYIVGLASSIAILSFKTLILAGPNMPNNGFSTIYLR